MDIIFTRLKGVAMWLGIALCSGDQSDLLLAVESSWMGSYCMERIEGIELNPAPAATW